MIDKYLEYYQFHEKDADGNVVCLYCVVTKKGEKINFQIIENYDVAKEYLREFAYDNELYYLKNLEDLQLKELDIMEIYDTDSVNMENLFADDDLRLIWEREPAEEMTLKEVCEALGKKIKIKED